MMERLNNSYYKLTSLFHQDGKGSVSWWLNITNVNIMINISVVIIRTSSHETSHEIWWVPSSLQIPFQKNIYLHLLFIFVEFLKKCELLGNHATTNATENKKVTYYNISKKYVSTLYVYEKLFGNSKKVSYVMLTKLTSSFLV